MLAMTSVAYAEDGYTGSGGGDIDDPLNGLNDIEQEYNVGIPIIETMKWWFEKQAENQEYLVSHTGYEGSGGGDIPSADTPVTPTNPIELQLISTTLTRYFCCNNRGLSIADAPATTNLTLTDTAYNKIMEKYNAGYDIYIKIVTYESGGSNQWAYVNCIPHGKVVLSEVAATEGGGTVLRVVNNTDAALTCYSYSLYLNQSSSTASNFVYSGATNSGSGSMSSYKMNVGNGWNANSNSYGKNNYGCYYVILYSDGTSSNPQQPSTPVDDPDIPAEPTHTHSDVYDTDTTEYETNVTNTTNVTTVTTYDETSNTYNTTYDINNDVDLTPITRRMDAEIAVLEQMGIDLDSLGFDVRVLLAGIYVRATQTVALLTDILADMANLDRSTGDLVDLSDVEGYLEDILSAITNLQDEETNAPLMRGYLMGIYDDMEELLEGWPLDLSTLEGDVSAIKSAWDGYLSDWSDFLASFEDYMSDILDALGYLENLPVGNSDWWIPSDDNGLTLYEFDEPDSDPNWRFWEPEEVNIPAAEAAIRELFAKFPFCMLSQLAQMFVYLHAPAVAPRFDLPMPNPSDWSHPYMMHIDLSEFDTCAAVLRMGITLWVGVRLTQRSVRMWTKDEQVVE